MADLKLLEFSVTLPTIEEEDQTRNDIKRLFMIILPDVDLDKMEIKAMSGGVINSVYRVQCEDKLYVIKVFTEKTERLVPVENSVIAMRAVQLAGQGADVLAWFTNGIVYTYQEGEILMPRKDELNNKGTRRLVVKKLAKLNLLNAKSLKICGYTLPSEDQTERYVRRCFTYIQEDFDGETLSECALNILKTKNSVMMEYDWISNEVRSLQLENVFSHRDIWWSNVLYDKNKDIVHFVDYDLSGYDPFPFDLTCALLRMKFDWENFTLEQLTEDEDRSLCRLYIEETRQLKGNNKPVTEEDVNILFAFTKLFKPFAWLSLSITLLSAVIIRDPSFNGAVGPCDRLYCEFKEDYLSYREKNKTIFIKQWKIYENINEALDFTNGTSSHGREDTALNQ